MVDVIKDLLPYYEQPGISALVAEVIEATEAIDTAFAWQEQALEALVERFQELKDERMARYNAEDDADVSAANS
jgi:hypothetical protein